MKIANCQEQGDQDLPHSLSLHCKYTLNLNKRCKIIIVYTFLTVCEIFPIHLISIEKADIKVCLYFVTYEISTMFGKLLLPLNYRFTQGCFVPSLVENGPMVLETSVNRKSLQTDEQTVDGQTDI